jgi:uncharacterized protein (DUF1778 family)
MEFKNIALNNKKAYLGLRITTNEKELIEKYAKKNNTSITKLVRGILLDYIQEQEQNNKQL